LGDGGWGAATPSLYAYDGSGQTPKPLFGIEIRRGS